MRTLIFQLCFALLLLLIGLLAGCSDTPPDTVGQSKQHQHSIIQQPVQHYSIDQVRAQQQLANSLLTSGIQLIDRQLLSMEQRRF